VHPDGDVADAGPGVEPGPQRPERAIVGRHRASRKAERRDEESAALVEHALLDDLVRPQEERLRDRQAERFGSFVVDHQLELRRLRHCGG
jgi:hypothetical protein